MEAYTGGSYLKSRSYLEDNTPILSYTKRMNFMYAGKTSTSSSRYETNQHYKLNFQNNEIIHENFEAEQFLKQNRPYAELVRDEEQKRKVIDYTKQAFEIITGEELPSTIQIKILEDEEFTVVHAMFNKGEEVRGNGTVLGFSINSQGLGTNKIFARQDNLDRLLITLGHEIGHVMNPTLPNSQDEEAKAFSFSLAWMEAIVQNNIAGLNKSITINPANNGLHDVAFNFVKNTIFETGKKAIDLFKDLSTGITSMANRLELVQI